MEREVHDILGPLGIDQSLSRRIAGSLLSEEAKLPPTLEAQPGFFKLMLNKIARKPTELNNNNAQGPNYGTLEVANQKAFEGDCDKGMTAFLLQFGEQAEEVPTKRLFICALRHLLANPFLQVTD